MFRAAHAALLRAPRTRRAVPPATPRRVETARGTRGALELSQRPRAFADAAKRRTQPRVLEPLSTISTRRGNPRSVRFPAGVALGRARGAPSRAAVLGQRRPPCCDPPGPTGTASSAISAAFFGCRPSLVARTGTETRGRGRLRPVPPAVSALTGVRSLGGLYPRRGTVPEYNGGYSALGREPPRRTFPVGRGQRPARLTGTTSWQNTDRASGWTAR
jgi:hypothetical protein